MKHQFGVGLRHQHFPYLAKNPKTKVGWFEVISENFLNTKGYPKEVLLKVRKDYPISLHGVSLSIGARSDLCKDYLTKLYLQKFDNELREEYIINNHPESLSHNYQEIKIHGHTY